MLVCVHMSVRIMLRGRSARCVPRCTAGGWGRGGMHGVYMLMLLLVLVLMLMCMLLGESVTWAAKVVNARIASGRRVRPWRWCGCRSFKTRMAQMRRHRFVVSRRSIHASIATGRVLTLAAEECVIANTAIDAQRMVNRESTGLCMSMLMRMILLQSRLGETSYSSFETKSGISSCGIPRITTRACTCAENVLARTGHVYKLHCYFLVLNFFVLTCSDWN